MVSISLTLTYTHISNKQTIEAGQALREDAPDVRKEIEVKAPSGDQQQQLPVRVSYDNSSKGNKFSIGKATAEYWDEIDKSKQQNEKVLE